jgi:hypothetical protein
MKKILLSILVLASVFLISCREMDQDYKEYVVPNGIVYTQKADSLKIYPGLNRVKIEWRKAADPKVIRAEVYWDNYTDTVGVDIPAGKDTISVIIDNLKENTYTFYVRTFDADGNSSILSDVTGDAYGANYIQSLSSRQLTMISSNDRVGLYWGAVASNVTRVVINYVASSGQTVERNIPLDENPTIITDFKQGGAIKIFTYYLPFTNALDDVAAITETVFPDVLEEVRIPTDRFKNAALPGDYYTPYYNQSQFRLENVWDGDGYNGSIYATDATSPIPQHFTIDLGRTVIIDRFKMYPRSSEMYSGSAPRFVEIWGTEDPPKDGSFENWHKIGVWEQFKPSGYGEGANVGIVTNEDIEWFRGGGNYLVEATDEIPNPYIPIKYLRFKIVHTFDSYAYNTIAGYLVIADLQFWGRIIE